MCTVNALRRFFSYDFTVKEARYIEHVLELMNFDIKVSNGEVRIVSDYYARELTALDSCLIITLLRAFDALDEGFYYELEKDSIDTSHGVRDALSYLFARPFSTEETNSVCTYLNSCRMHLRIDTDGRPYLLNNEGARIDFIMRNILVYEMEAAGVL